MQQAEVTAPATVRPVGMVAVIGRPNVGKSTLVNALVGEHVSITSRKPQTTRDRVLGVRTDEDAQYIFVDTPGFQRRHRNELNRRMNDTVTRALNDVDAIVLVIESGGWAAGDEQVLQLLLPQSDKEALKDVSSPRRRGPSVVKTLDSRLRGNDNAGVDQRLPNVILAINKSDLLTEREKLLPLMADSMQRYPFKAIVPVSAEKSRQLDDLLKEIRPLLPEGMLLFDAEQYTDRSARFLAAESVREKAYRLLGDELPYGIAVTIERWDESRATTQIAATLIVEREAHRPIVIGKDGAKLREISRLARADIEQTLGKPVFLEVWVRVKRGWNDDARALKSLGYE